MIQPPTIGPTVGASTAKHASESGRETLARLLERGGTLLRRRPGSACRRKSPEGPRQAISVEKWSLAAQPTDARVKTDTDSTNSQHMLSKRVRKPVNGIATTSAHQIGGLHPAHLIRLGCRERSESSASEVATTCTSRIAMNMPTHIMANPIDVETDVMRRPDCCRSSAFDIAQTPVNAISLGTDSDG